MRVKKPTLKPMTKETKTLNVDVDVHQRVKLEAAKEGVKIADYAEAAIEVGLKRPKEIKRLLEDRTRQAELQGLK